MSGAAVPFTKKTRVPSESCQRRRQSRHGEAYWAQEPGRQIPERRDSDHPFFFQAEDGIRDLYVTGVQTCALPIWFSAVNVGIAGSAPRRCGASSRDCATAA